MRPDQVTAVIVTRGDVDLAPVLDSLIFSDVVVWNNSLDVDAKTHGRVLALARAKNAVIYSQDDDIVHTAESQQRIIDAYQPDTLVGCMWPDWSQGAKDQGIPYGYDDLVFMGSGSVFDRNLPADTLDLYLDYYPADDFLDLWSDTLVGVIADTMQLDIRFEALPCAENDNRMCNLDDAVALKTEAIRRGREVRDGWHEDRAVELLYEVWSKGDDA